MSVLYAETSVDGVLPSFDKTYAYLIKENADKIRVGTRVIVPFGNGNKPHMAVVTGITDVRPDAKRIKSIIRAVDDEPVITPEMLKTAFWIKDAVMANIFAVPNVIASQERPHTIRMAFN